MAKPADPLETYNRKRDFAKTAEPRGTVGTVKKLSNDGKDIERGGEKLKDAAD